ncbi:MAG: metallophosphoesterase, partial [Alkalibacterium sp.]|uniref:metallophosphoesterase n=1 Tax=Alkalibacterium sp. TaxID=1872447 RepID=UPI003970478B
MKLKTKLFLSIFSLLVIGVYLYWGNNAIETTQYSYSSDEIPQSFDGYTIVQVSDLHNKEFDEKLTTKIEAENPDIIVITGDLIDRNRTDLTVAQDFLEEASDIAPLYFVSGNHEVASNKYPELQEILDEEGVINLDNTSHTLTENNEQINLLGLADPLTMLLEEIEEEGSDERVLQKEMTDLMNESPADFNLLLSHRAELLDIYEESGVDLVFTGHAHGGQIRLPIIGGLYSPGQGLLPGYTIGEYTEGNTTMIVSRGLGNSIFPLRVFNRPELVVMTLEAR